LIFLDYVALKVFNFSHERRREEIFLKVNNLKKFRSRKYESFEIRK
jgi:hypothetical protein